MVAALSGPDYQVTHAPLGTRFRVFPQPPFVPGYERPETIWIASPPGLIGSGPADDRMYVVDPIEPKAPYAYPVLPPYSGNVYEPAHPNADGHFDEIPINSRSFLSAHLYACVRRVWDVCQGYLGEPIDWYFEDTHPRLELVPLVPWDNAHTGYGFIEMGEDGVQGQPFPLALSFDAIAHETAHLALHGVMGIPDDLRTLADYQAYHESMADIISVLSLLSFESVRDRVLFKTKGNLFLVNELDRFAELSDERQIRVLSHSLKQSDVGHEVHDRSKPLSGALFDTLIEMFHLLLFERGLSGFDISGIMDLRVQLSDSEIQAQLATSRRDFELRQRPMSAALAEARDLLGEAILRSWTMLSPNDVSLPKAAEVLVVAAEQGRARRFADRLAYNLHWRGLLMI
ncbi:MAG TPA: hypothetical protein VGU45_11555 [Microvirga sp.]|jgi:hypothetical protein|nr:hypothetical protein [Microvirga sp.]